MLTVGALEDQPAALPSHDHTRNPNLLSRSPTTPRLEPPGSWRAENASVWGAGTAGAKHGNGRGSGPPVGLVARVSRPVGGNPCKMVPFRERVSWARVAIRGCCPSASPIAATRTRLAVRKVLLVFLAVRLHLVRRFGLVPLSEH